MKKLIKNLNKFVARKIYHVPKTVDLYFSKKIKKIIAEGYNHIPFSCVCNDVSIGLGTYFGESCVFVNTKIGRFCSIGPRVKVVCGRHPTSKFVSTHPFCYSKNCKVFKKNLSEQKFDEFKYTKNGYSVEIGSDVWVGSDVIILEGVEIGNGAIIGAGAVVTKSVPAYAIVVGNPAKIIRFRFEEEQINKLEKIKWWNWDINVIFGKLKVFDDIDIFLKNYE